MSDEKATPMEELEEDMPEATAPPEDIVPVEFADVDTDIDSGLMDADQDQLAELKAESDRNLAGWQRTLAEFQNYKRRVERENAEVHTRTTIETIRSILPIIDDFERAVSSVPEDLVNHPWINGITLIQDKFKKLLDEYDIDVLDPVGLPFDPNHHQAISKDDHDEVESDHVIETLQKGYISGSYLLRPALVRVAN